MLARAGVGGPRTGDREHDDVRSAAATPARGLTIGVFIAVLASPWHHVLGGSAHPVGIRLLVGRSRDHGVQNGMAIAGEFLSAAAFLASPG